MLVCRALSCKQKQRQHNYHEYTVAGKAHYTNMWCAFNGGRGLLLNAGIGGLRGPKNTRLQHSAGI